MSVPPSLPDETLVLQIAPEEANDNFFRGSYCLV